MTTEKPKLPGVKGKHLHNPANDGSVTHTLRGGPFKDLVVKLFPEANGWERFVLDTHVYRASPTDQDPKKPYMTYEGEQ